MAIDKLSSDDLVENFIPTRYAMVQGVGELSFGSVNPRRETDVQFDAKNTTSKLTSKDFLGVGYNPLTPGDVRSRLMSLQYPYDGEVVISDLSDSNRTPADYLHRQRMLRSTVFLTDFLMGGLESEWARLNQILQDRPTDQSKKVGLTFLFPGNEEGRGTAWIGEATMESRFIWSRWDAHEDLYEGVAAIQALVSVPMELEKTVLVLTLKDGTKATLCGTLREDFVFRQPSITSSAQDVRQPFTDLLISDDWKNLIPSEYTRLKSPEVQVASKYTRYRLDLRTLTRESFEGCPSLPYKLVDGTAQSGTQDMLFFRTLQSAECKIFKKNVEDAVIQVDYEKYGIASIIISHNTFRPEEDPLNEPRTYKDEKLHLANAKLQIICPSAITEDEERGKIHTIIANVTIDVDDTPTKNDSRHLQNSVTLSVQGEELPEKTNPYIIQGHLQQSSCTGHEISHLRYQETDSLRKAPHQESMDQGNNGDVELEFAKSLFVFHSMPANFLDGNTGYFARGYLFGGREEGPVKQSDGEESDEVLVSNVFTRLGLH